MKYLFLLLLFLFVVPAHSMFLVFIGDYVWEDLNRNGLQDQGEPPIPGVVVNYELPFQGEYIYYGSTVTDQNGFYSFWAGWQEVTIKIEIPEGYEATTPLQGNDFTKDSDFDSNGNIINKIDVEYWFNKFGGSIEEFYFFDMGLVKIYHEDNCRTIGFWKNNIKKAIDNKKGMQVNKDDLISWLYKINQYYLQDPFVLGLSDEEILRKSYNILSYSGSNIYKKTMRQLIACELNLLSEEFSLRDVKFHDHLCKQSEDALYNNSISDLYQLHDKLDWVNNQ